MPPNDNPCLSRSLPPVNPTVGAANNAETVADIKKVFEQANSELKAAQKILVIGGGPVGIEMAGEIMEEMPAKIVTLVTSKEPMAAPNVTFPDKFRNRLRKKLEQVKTNVKTKRSRTMYGQMVQQHDIRAFRTLFFKHQRYTSFVRIPSFWGCCTHTDPLP